MTGWGKERARNSGLGTLFPHRCHRERNHRLRTLGYICAQRRVRHVPIAMHIKVPHVRHDTRSHSSPMNEQTNTEGEDMEFAWTIRPTGC